MAEHESRADITQLVADHHAVLYRYAYRLSGSPVDAEDLVQQTYLTALRKLDQVQSANAFRSWLFAVLRNTYLKSCRKRALVHAADWEISLENLPEEVREPPRVDSQELQAALDELPAEFRVVVLMFYFEHRSYKEIAVELDLPLGTVMSRLSRAKSHLRMRLTADEPELRPTDNVRHARII